MRVKRDAPVDLVGPQTLYDRSAPLEIQRFQILYSLMLSPQTKDEITALCSMRLQKFSIQEVASMPQGELKKLIYEVNFNTTKAERV